MKSKSYQMNDQSSNAGTGRHQRKCTEHAHTGCGKCLDVTKQIWTLKAPIMLFLAFIVTLPLPILVPSQVIQSLLCVRARARACVCVCAVSYTHLTLPTKLSV